MGRAEQGHLSTPYYCDLCESACDTRWHGNCHTQGHTACIARYFCTFSEIGKKSLKFLLCFHSTHTLYIHVGPRDHGTHPGLYVGRHQAGQCPAGEGSHRQPSRKRRSQILRLIHVVITLYFSRTSYGTALYIICEFNF